MEKYVKNEGSDCTDSANMPKDYTHCFNPYFVWAVGGESFFLPKDVGFPVGEDGSDTYFLIQNHYNNPDLVEGVVDSSGFEFQYTKIYRKFEAFTMTVGSPVDHRVYIPPKQPAFHMTGHCHTKCFEGVSDLSLFIIKMN